MAGRYTAYFRLQTPAPAGSFSAEPAVRFGQRVWGDVFVELPPSSAGATSAEANAASSTGAQVTVAAAETPSGSASAATASASAGGAADSTAVDSTTASIHAAAVDAIAASYHARWPHYLATLASMGFTDAVSNGQLLEAHAGNISAVVATLLEHGAPAARPA